MTRAALASVLGIAVAACGSSNPTLAIVIDLPPTSSPAYPFAEGVVDTLQLAVASTGDPTNIDSTSRPIDEEIQLDDVSFGRDLVLHLYGKLDTAVVAYGRSCPFDFEGESDNLEVIHIYFSRLVRWGTGAVPALAGRIDGHLLEREGGGIVIAGGTVEAPLELFNPRTGELTVLDEAPNTQARVGGRLATLGLDRAIIVGGTSGGQPVTSVEVLPDLRDSLSDGLGLRGHAAAALVGDRALVAGGHLWQGDQFVLSDAAFEFSVGDGGALESPRRVGSLVSARHMHSMTRLSNEVGAAVLVAGGLDASGAPVAATEVYRPLNSIFESVPGKLVRWDHQAIRVPGGAVLIVGGYEPSVIDGSEVPALTMALFDPIQRTFAAAGDLPTSAGVVGFTATTLPDGRILLAGGRDASGELVKTAFIARFDPLNGQVDISETDDLSAPRADHTAVLACDGTVLIVGGDSTSASPPIERYNPPERR